MTQHLQQDRHAGLFANPGPSAIASFHAAATPALRVPCRNKLLAALPAAKLERLMAHMELVPLARDAVLQRSGEPMLHAYFPTTAIVSLRYGLASGASGESAGVGNEGMVGVSIFMGQAATQGSAVVLHEGHAYRLAGHLLKQEFNRADALQRLLLRYTQVLMAQVTQCAACNRYHTVEQAFCRWLLQAFDRCASRELALTHEKLAGILGVRREGVSEAAGKLRRNGVISYHRGRVALLDRRRLEARTCECYASIAKELAGLPADRGHASAPEGNVLDGNVRQFPLRSSLSN